MSDFILCYLNETLKFSPKVKNVKDEFSDGYYFGKVIYKLGDLSKKDFLENFEKKKTKSNYKYLFNFLRDFYNIDINSDYILGVERGEKEKIFGLIYKIRCSSAKKKIGFWQQDYLNEEEKKKRIMRIIMEKDNESDVKDKKDVNCNDKGDVNGNNSIEGNVSRDNNSRENISVYNCSIYNNNSIYNNSIYNNSIYNNRYNEYEDNKNNNINSTKLKGKIEQKLNQKKLSETLEKCELSVLLGFGRRLEYEKILKNRRRKQELIKNSRIFVGLSSVCKKEKKEFSGERLFNSLATKNSQDFSIYLSKKKAKREQDIPLIKNIVYLIIDLVIEYYFYFFGKEKKLIDLDTYRKWNLLFCEGKYIREKIDNKELKETKKKNSFDIDNFQDIMFNKDINLVSLLQDYLNYKGLFRASFLSSKEQEQIDIRKIKHNLNHDYEPRNDEIESLRIPKVKGFNFEFGNKIIRGIVKEKKVINTVLKWEHIPYKICLYGNPFCGQEKIIKHIKEKYPKFKEYSIQNLTKKIYDKWVYINEDIENNQKYKNLKANQINSMKEEKEKCKKNFEIYYQMLPEYINKLDDELKKAIQESSSDDLTEHFSLEKNSYIFFDKIILTPKEKLNLITYTIETDFPIISSDEILNEIKEFNTKIREIEEKIEALKEDQDPKKKNKNENSINNLNKEIENIKKEIFKGIILVDFPSTIEECKLLEEYLSGYKDYMEIPKSDYELNISELSQIYDIKISAPNKELRKSGIDFIFEMPEKEEKECDNNFSNMLYDNVNDVLYNKNDIYDEKGKLLIEKKIADSLVNYVPFYPKNIYEIYKDNYKKYRSNIRRFYNNFGFSSASPRTKSYISLSLPEPKEQLDTYIFSFLFEIKFDEERDDLREKIIGGEEEVNHPSNQSNYIRTPLEAAEEALSLTSPSNRITNDLNYSIKIAKNNKTKYSKSLKKVSNQVAKNCFLREDIALLKKLFVDLKGYSELYRKNIEKFIVLFEEQRKNIYDRFETIQKKFREYVNLDTIKKDYINEYIQEYNDNVGKWENDNEFNKKFQKRLVKLNEKLYEVMIEKKKECLNELKSIKKANYFEIELIKFYHYIHNLIENEAKFFINNMKFILLCYHLVSIDAKEFDGFNDKINENVEDINPSPSFSIDSINTLIKDNLEILFENSLKIVLDSEDIIQNSNNYINVTYQSKNYGSSLKIINEFRSTHKKNTNNFSGTGSNKNDISIMTGSGDLNKSIINNNHNGNNLIDEFRRIVDNEKNRFKFRIVFLREIAGKYSELLTSSTLNTFHNLDNWIIQNVWLQNNAVNIVISSLRLYLAKKEKVEKEKIDEIELDQFEKISEDGLVTPFEDKKSIQDFPKEIYPNIDYQIFSENKAFTEEENGEEILIESFQTKRIHIIFENLLKVFHYMKAYEIEQGILSIDYFMNVFVKLYINGGNKSNNNVNLALNETGASSLMKNEFLIGGISEEINLGDMDKIFDILKSKDINKIVEYFKIINEYGKKERENEEKEKEKDNLKINNLNNGNIGTDSDGLNTEENESKNKDKESEKIKTIIKEYSDYINLNKVFTLFPLLFAPVLTEEIKNEILKKINEINDNNINYSNIDDIETIEKESFYKLKFWFEDLFIYEEENKENSIKNGENECNDNFNIGINEDSHITIKDYLFEIWKTDDEQKIYFNDFISVLNLNQYMKTELIIKERTSNSYYNILIK